MPRFEWIWSREGLGRFEGAARASVYYTVANDGRSVHAVDVISGKTLWQTALPETVDDSVHTRIANDAVVLAYRKTRESVDAVIARLSLADGRMSWSKVIACPDVDSRSAGLHFYLLCGGHSSRSNTEVREFDTSTGKELARVSLVAPFDFVPGGEVCGTSNAATWCGWMAGGRIDVQWAQPESGSVFEVAGEYVIRMGAQIVVRGMKDGRILWQHAGQPWIFAHKESERLFVLGDDGVEVLRLGDGARLAGFAKARRGGADFLSDGDLVLIVPYVPEDEFVYPVDAQSDESVYLVDAQSHVRTIARNVKFFSQVAGGMLLSRNVGMSGKNRDVAHLDAYSLLALPEDGLDPYHKVVAVLDRFPISYEASEALAELRPIPGAMAELEKVISTGPAHVRIPAIAVAGLTGDPRFLAPLRARLEAINAPPADQKEWDLIHETVDALSSLHSPEASSALLAFWRTTGVNVFRGRPRIFLRDAVASSIWRYGARKEWVPCEDTVFPVDQSPPDQATLGTESPGVEYAVDVQRRWAAICQAREDDDGNGKLEVETGFHGDTYGDRLRPYLVLGSGPGTEIDDFVAAAPDSRWVVVTKNMCVHLVDAQNGKAVVLKGADGRPGDTVAGGHRAASFSPDGTNLLYIKTDGDRATVVQRDLRSGVERIIDPGRGELSRAFFEPSGRFVVLDVIVRDTDRDGRLQPPWLASNLSMRRCRGPAASSTSFGAVGDKPIQRIVAVNGDAAVMDAPRGTTFHPATPPRARYELAWPGDVPVVLPSHPLPLGPFHWQLRQDDGPR